MKGNQSIGSFQWKILFYAKLKLILSVLSALFIPLFFSAASVHKALWNIDTFMVIPVIILFAELYYLELYYGTSDIVYCTVRRKSGIFFIRCGIIYVLLLLMAAAVLLIYYRKQQRALSPVRIVRVHLHICFFRRILLYGHQPDPQQFHGDRCVVGTVCNVLLCRLLQTEHHTQYVCLSGLSALGIRKAILSGCRDRTACLQRPADRAVAV